MWAGARVRGWFEALFVVGAVIATLLIVDHFEMSPFDDEAKKPQPVRRSVPLEGRGDSRRSDPTATDRQRRRNTADAEIAERARQASREQQLAQDRHVLSQMMETCRYWSGQPFAQYQQDMRAQACNRALRFAHEKGLPRPTIPDGTGRKIVQGLAAQTQYVVTPDECTPRFKEGSVEYRRCRARIGEGLHEKCRTLTSQSLSAAPSNPEVREWARAYCRAAERYKIVR